MKKKNILLITDEPAVKAMVEEALGEEFQLELASSLDQAKAILAATFPQLVIIDFELKGEDGLALFKKLGTRVKTIMLSSSNSVPLAVTATKLGVAQFLRKPIHLDEFKAVVARNLVAASLSLPLAKRPVWLTGQSQKLVELFGRVKEALAGHKDIILVGALGIPLDSLVTFIHQASLQNDGPLFMIDAADFQGEGQEALFWTTLQEAFRDKDGTLYIKNIDAAGEHFKRSLIDFVKQKGRGGRTIMGLTDKGALIGINLSTFALIFVPTLLERGADIPCLIKAYIHEANQVSGKAVSSISLDGLELLMEYHFPGNYLELRALVKQAVVATASHEIGLAELPISLEGFKQMAKESSLADGLSLMGAKNNFEKKLYNLLDKKMAEDLSRTANFLGLSRQALVDRLESLAD